MKRFLSLLLVAAMLLAIPVMPLTAQAAAETNITDPTSDCPCCGVPMDELEWTVWDASVGANPPAGHYYLAKDYNQTSVKSVMAWDKVVLDLRGHKWSSYTTTVMPAASNYRMMSVSGYFYLMDTAGGGVVEAQMKANYGGAFFTDENEHAEPMIHILSGTIRPRPGERAATNGGLIYAYESGIVKMTGGVIENGEAVSGEAGAILGGPNSKILIHGGMIRNCKAKTNGGAIKSTGIVEIKNAEILNCSAERDGGAVYGTKSILVENSTIAANSCGRWGGGLAISGGTLNVVNSVVDGNVANYTTSYYNGGGNLYAASGAVATLTGCTLKNGYSANQGGNIFVTSATVNINNTTVTGGVARTGDNLRAYKSTTNMDGADIKGDVVIEGGSLTMKNATKIGLNGAGLVVYTTPTINASELTEGAEIYVQHVTSGGTVAAAGAKIEYFRPAYRAVLSGGDGTTAITATIAADGVTAGYCPHCSQQVAWSAFDAANLTTGHYYLSTNTTASVTVPATADMVLDLNGKTLTGAATGRTITNLGKLAIVDSGVGTYNTTQWNGGVILGSGGKSTSGTNGGVLHNNGTFKLYGGTMRYAKDDARLVERGGVIYNYSTGNMYIYGGLIDGTAYNNTTATGSCLDAALPEGLGGAFHGATGSKLTMTAGRMLGGTAYGGGTAGFDGNVTVNITGGTFSGGTATMYGGNLYFAGAANNGSVQVKNVTITEGTSTMYGGNIFFGYYTTNTFDNCIVANGTVTAEGSYGGNAHMSAAGALTVKNSTFLAGNAYTGGNLSVNNTSADVTLDSCRLLSGATQAGASRNGGNLQITGGAVTVQGGEILNGVAGSSAGGVGGNICCGANGKLTVKKNTAGQVTKILGGNAKFGGNITVMGNVTLTDAQMNGGNVFSGGVGKDLQISGASAKLTVGGGVVGNISVWPSEGNSLTYGAVIAKTASTGLNENANITMESVAGAPKAVAKDGALYVAGVQVVDSEGNAQWCADFTTAQQQEGYVKLYDDMSITLTKDTFVDLNGNAVTVSGTGKLYGMDSSGDGYELPTGKVTFTGTNPVAHKELVKAPNGKQYVALVDGNTVTYHRLGADLTNVTINVDKNAVYFKGKFGADETLKAMIDTYGIAVSLSGMPDSRLSDTCKSVFNGAEMANNEISSGVYITNILRKDLTDKQNDNRGREKIYATAYVTLTDGTTTYISDDSTTSADNVAWSLYDCFTRLDELIDEDPTNFRRHTNTMRDYYAKWKDNGIADWVGENTNFIAPPEDDVIDILMIGSSFCTYYVEELWQIANASGLKVRVCNVYYSGCPLSKYYNDWMTGTAAYQFYETTGEKRTSFPGSKTLEWCLAQGEWDVISMQESSSGIRTNGVQGHLNAVDLYTDTLFTHIRTQFPKAKFYYHQTWGYQVGYNRNGYVVETSAEQADYADKQKQFAIGLMDKYSMANGSEYKCLDGRIPSGEAWQLVRDGFGGYDPYDDLCRRTGTASNLGDYYHDGDLGGGQYLNALTWFFKLTNDMGYNYTAADIKWAPDNTTYGHPITFNAKQLQECAYQAVNVGWTYDAANYQ